MALTSKAVESEIYASLGLEERDRGVYPRVLSILASVLQRTINKNEKLLKASRGRDIVSIFHCSTVPTISIQEYVERIFKYTSCSPSCFVVAYIYLQRLLQRTGAYLTSFNVHRLLITTSMIAAKFIDDECNGNAYYAKVGGVSTEEMNRMEIKFLFNVDFRLHVTPEDFRKYCLQLHKEGRNRYRQP